MAMRRSYQQIIAGLVCAVCVSVAGESILRAETDDAVRPIKTVIEQKFPGMKVLRVSKTEIPGWLLVESDSDRVENYMYVHESGRYVLSGALFDIQMGRNVTQEYVRERQQALLAGMDTSKTILLSPMQSKLERPVLVFDDPDCRFCQQFHPEVQKLVEAGVPVAVVLYPLVRTHPDAYRKSVAIWCAPDQAEALGRALMSKPVMGEVGACSHPIDENIKLGKRLGVNSTPMVFLPNGQSFAGYRPASEVLALLQIEAQQK